MQRNISANNEKVKSNNLKFEKIKSNDMNKKRMYSDNKINLKSNDLNEINEFMKEFGDINNLDTFEERKYNIPSKINIQEINSFFDMIKENQNFFG